jgi:hypothetical protein
MLVLLDAIDGRDVRVVQRGYRAGFALEPSDALGVGGEVVRQRLQGNVAPELRVASLPHLAHAATANEGNDLVMSYARAGLHALSRSTGLVPR